jgi:hypothetical protein
MRLTRYDPFFSKLSLEPSVGYRHCADPRHYRVNFHQPKRQNQPFLGSAWEKLDSENLQSAIVSEAGGSFLVDLFWLIVPLVIA